MFLVAACGRAPSNAQTADTAVNFVRAAGLPLLESEVRVSGQTVKFGDSYTAVVSTDGNYVKEFTNELRRLEVDNREQLPNSILVRDPQAARSRLGELAIKLQLLEGADIVSFENGDKGEVSADFRVYPEHFQFVDPKLANGMTVMIDGKDGALLEFRQNRDTVVENSRVQISRQDAIKKSRVSNPDKVELMFVPRPGSRSRVRLAYVIEGGKKAVWIDAADGVVMGR